MVEIRTAGEAIDLPSGFAVTIEDSNPIFNDRGSQSVPATVPATRRNFRLLSAPYRIDVDADPNNPERTAEVVSGAYSRPGVMNITEAGRDDGITFNIGFDNSAAYAKWRAKKLSELDLPVYKPDDSLQGNPVDLILDELFRIYKTPQPKVDDFAVFPIAVNNESTGTDEDKKTYWEVFNLTGTYGLQQPATVKRLIDGELTDVSVPGGYMVSPFLRVWRVLELIFDNIGVVITANPFKSDTELARLVVLNNAADAVCRGEIRYADIMPDCTVEEFLKALWVRFGLVYNIDSAMATVRLEFLRDIINRPAVSRAIDPLAAGHEKIIYEGPQYVKLSAKTSIEGASPGSERFEDFVKGVNIGSVRLGAHVSQWQNTGTAQAPKWDGDVNDDYYDPWEDWTHDQDFPDPEQPDPDNPDPDYTDSDDGQQGDGSEFDDYSTSAGTTVQKNNTTILAREFVTGMWYRLDATNGKVRLSSSSFFNWDPQPEGHTALELSSEDEFVPVMRVSTVGLGVGHTFNDICPAYLFGARHYHSYIKGSDDTDNSGDSTPLAFMFAYTKDNKTFGRLNPEGDNGLPLTLDDGTTPTLSLLFQFKDGLFAKFWTYYDELLRHGNRAVELKARINKALLSKIDLLDVYTFKGIRCLIDTMSYALTGAREVEVTLRLRTIQPVGSYDIAAEQAVPDFSAGTRHLEWRLLGDNYGDALDTAAVRKQAADAYIATNNYTPHGPDGDYRYISGRGAVIAGMTRLLPTWSDDATLPTPTSIGQNLTRMYNARLIYDIYEVHDMSVQDGPDDWELDETPIGRQAVIVQYKAIIAPKWVAG